MDRKDVLKLISDKGLRTVQFWLTDILGNPRVTQIPSSGLDRSLDEGIPLDGSSVAGQADVDDSDLSAIPDLSSLRLIPASSGGPEAAVFFCDVFRADRTALAVDSRSFLRKTLAEAAARGFDRFEVLPELEFYYFKSCERPDPADAGHYFEPPRDDDSSRAFAETVRVLEDLGFDIRVFHHEGGPGQHEIEFMLGEALWQADNLTLAKVLVKSIGHAHDLHASFMPKPIGDKSGSGMHVHQSLWTRKSNRFFDPSARDNLSEVAMKYLAGLLAHAQDITSFTNPTINSYKRLVPGHEAPTFLTWGIRNRLSLIRVPAFSREQPSRCRFEYRAADPMANPYLVMGLMLAAGLDGIDKEMTAPPVLSVNTDRMTPSQRREAGFQCLPGNLEDALNLTEASDFMNRTMGESFVKKYVAAKRRELDAFRCHVTDWEIKTYM